MGKVGLMKAWPEDGSTVPCEDLLFPLVEAFKFYYGEPGFRISDYASYDGYNIAQEDLAGALGASIFQDGAMEWDFEDQGREPIHQLLLLAFQLGIEQGRRIVRR